MAIDFSAQFDRGEKDIVYKGVHLQNKGRRRESRNPHTQEYEFVSWRPHPTLGHLIDYGNVGTLSLLKRDVNDLLKQGYRVQPNGHLLSPQGQEQ